LLIDEAGVKDKDFYSTGDVFPMLKVSQRIYQLWERRPDFPIKEPHRIKGNRAYSPQDVVAIAFWKWRRKDKRMREGGD
jgi:DNA-binding transcriptional MerR regulator